MVSRSILYRISRDVELTWFHLDPEQILQNLTHAIYQVNVNADSDSNEAVPTIGPAYALMICLITLREVEHIAPLHKHTEQCTRLFESLLHLVFRVFDIGQETDSVFDAKHLDPQAREILENLMKLCIDGIGEHDFNVLDKPLKLDFDLSLPLPQLRAEYMRWSTPSEGKTSLIPDAFVSMLGRITHRLQLELSYGADLEYVPGYFDVSDLDLGLRKSPRYEALYRLQFGDAHECAPHPVNDGDGIAEDLAGDVVMAVEVDHNVLEA